MAASNINEVVEMAGCYCLNERGRQSFKHLFAGDHTLALHSDADEQLLLQIKFRQANSFFNFVAKYKQLALTINICCVRL